MPMTNAEKQAAHRARRAKELKARTAALEEIIEVLKDNDKPMAEKVRSIAWAALHDDAA